MPDFFVSYTSPDKRWAEWIAYVLEEANFNVVIQAWDFRPGSNFMLEMQQASMGADRTIMVLSQAYTASQFAQSEWAAAMVRDPQGMKRKLIPVRVEDCEVEGLLTSIVYIDLVGLDENAASRELLAGVMNVRAKPDRRPSFPGVEKQSHVAFPAAHRPAPAQIHMPRLNRKATDADKRRFVKQAFAVVRSHFEQGLAALSAQYPDTIETDFQPGHSEFSAEVFVNGDSTAACHIWLGGLGSKDGISYAEGKHHPGKNSWNDELSPTQFDDGLFLTALMGDTFGKFGDSIDLKRLTQDQAADYLWRRFSSALERLR